MRNVKTAAEFERFNVLTEPSVSIHARVVECTYVMTRK